jgi:hypothetical protein
MSDLDNQPQQAEEEEWVPYKGYVPPKQSRAWQVIDVLFVLILCYVCLLIPILLTGKMIVG